MIRDTTLNSILRAPQSVFTINDLRLMLSEPCSANLRRRLHYYVQKGSLYRIRNGLYAKDRAYNVFECATKLYTPSYVSLETVLYSEGLVFQYYRSISCMSYLARDIIVDQNTFSYHRCKANYLANSLGIIQYPTYMRATPERAFVDILYLNSQYYFDNLSSLNWDLVFRIANTVQNKQLTIRINRYYKAYQDA